ncbi:MAG TPA: tetraacyldisaccharide 4'-kinase [Myxococcota bacterium]|nr:tetraacyldisaccharide 4'-kinase [Myxococcota bacterium]
MDEPRTNSLIERIWYSEGHLPGERFSALALTPLSWVYRLGLAMRAGPKPVKVDRPVISVGNLTVGGNGKTPLVIELVAMLESRAKRVAVVSRGYGRASRGLLVVSELSEESRTAAMAGDEPLLIARRCPQAGVVVGEDRLAAARLAIERCDPDVIILDDAFQHRRLQRDLNLCAIHADRGFGNGRLLPRGPLREPLSALQRADMLIFTYGGSKDIGELRSRHNLPDSIPACSCDFAPAGFSKGPELSEAEHPKDEPVFAVCAVAAGEGFLKTCNQAGLNVAGSLSFHDHHRFRQADIERIESACRRLGVETVVCTEKDLVRLPQSNTKLSYIGLRIEARWHEPQKIQGLLKSVG